MSDKILVTYASRAGSTAGVAQAIAESLAAGGAEVELLPMQEVTDLSACCAVVAGSAIRGSVWLPEALEFLHQHRTKLNQIPFAAFMVCITLSMKNADEYRQGLKEWMEPVRSLVQPVSEGYFAGALDFSKVHFTFNTLLMRLPVLFGLWKLGDHRDWDAIRDWAEDIRPLLGVNL